MGEPIYCSVVQNEGMSEFVTLLSPLARYVCERRPGAQNLSFTVEGQVSLYALLCVEKCVGAAPVHCINAVADCFWTR